MDAVSRDEIQRPSLDFDAGESVGGRAVLADETTAEPAEVDATNRIAASTGIGTRTARDFALEAAGAVFLHAVAVR